MNKNKLFLFVILFLFALGLRLYHLGQLPGGFHVDELRAGYVGKYLFHFGKDTQGHSFPLYFDTFGDFRPTGIFYLSGLSEFIFGVNEFAVRFPSALFGALTVIPIYLISSLLFKSKRAAIVTAIIFIFLPWHIVLSRATSESIVGLFFLVTALACFLKTCEKYSPRLLVIGSALFLCTYFFYHSFRFLVPLFIIPFYFYPGLVKKRRLIFAGISVGFFIASFILIMSAGGNGRLSQVIFFKNPILSNTQEQLLSSEGQSEIRRARTFHNKPILYAREFVSQYLSYFSPNFLFLQGGVPHRYRIPEHGLFPLLVIPFIFLGTFLAKPHKNKWPMAFLFYVIVIAPLPAALTYEDAPNVQRAMILMVGLTLLAGYYTHEVMGLLTQLRLIKQKAYVVLAAFFLLEFVYFWHQYEIHSAYAGNFYRNVTETTMMKRMVPIVHDFDQIIVPIYDDIPMYYLFYSNHFDEITQDIGKHATRATFDNVVFVDSYCPAAHLSDYPIQQGKILIIEKGDCRKPESDFVPLDSTIDTTTDTTKYVFYSVNSADIEDFKKPQ